MLNLTRAPSPPPRIVSQASGHNRFFFQSHGKVPLHIAQIYSTVNPGVFPETNIKTTVYFCRNERESKLQLRSKNKCQLLLLTNVITGRECDQ